jgi:hypothetical protein
MSYPIPNSKAKKKPVRFSTYSNPFDPLSSAPTRFSEPSSSSPSKDLSSASLALDSSLEHDQTSPNCCHKLVELIYSVLSNNHSEDSAAANASAMAVPLGSSPSPVGRNSRSDDLHVYVRRKGDFQVSCSLVLRLLLLSDLCCSCCWNL